MSSREAAPSGVIGTLGVLVAGGRGKRLGLGHPKAMALVAGQTLLDRSLDTLGAVCDQVVIVAPRACELPERGVPRIEDPSGASGPFAALVVGLTFRPYRRALGLGVDYPLMRTASLEALLAILDAGLRPGSRNAVVPVPGGIPQPLAAAYGPSAAAALSDRLARGERSVTAAVLSLDPLLVDEEELERWEGGSRVFFNLNLAQELTRVEAELAGSSRVQES